MDGEDDHCEGDAYAPMEAPTIESAAQAARSLEAVPPLDGVPPRGSVVVGAREVKYYPGRIKRLGSIVIFVSQRSAPTTVP